MPRLTFQTRLAAAAVRKTQRLAYAPAGVPRSGPELVRPRGAVVRASGVHPLSCPSSGAEGGSEPGAGGTESPAHTRV